MSSAKLSTVGSSAASLAGASVNSAIRLVPAPVRQSPIEPSSALSRPSKADSGVSPPPEADSELIAACAAALRSAKSSWSVNCSRTCVGSPLALSL